MYNIIAETLMTGGAGLDLLSGAAFTILSILPMMFLYRRFHSP